MWAFAVHYRKPEPQDTTLACTGSMLTQQGSKPTLRQPLHSHPLLDQHLFAPISLKTYHNVVFKFMQTCLLHFRVQRVAAYLSSLLSSTFKWSKMSILIIIFWSHRPLKPCYIWLERESVAKESSTSDNLFSPAMTQTKSLLCDWSCFCVTLSI